MKKDQKNGVKAAKGKNPMEIIFKRELELLEDDKKKIAKILGYFDLYDACDIRQLDLNEADEALLGMTDLLYTTVRSRKREGADNLWDMSVYLKNVYRYSLPIQYDSKWLFPKTKETMLRFILDQWSVLRHDNKRDQEIFMFIWDIYTDEHPMDERKVIDKVIREKLNDADPEDVGKWMKWIYTTIHNPSTGKEFRIIHEDLGQLFTLARCRKLTFDDAVHEVKNSIAVAELGLWNTEEAMPSALSVTIFRRTDNL